MALESRDSRNYVIFNRQPDCRCRFHGGFKPSSWFSWLFPFASMHPYIHPCIHASIHRYWLVQFSFLHIHTILHIDGWWICTGRQMDEQTEIQRSWLLVASSLPPFLSLTNLRQPRPTCATHYSCQGLRRWVDGDESGPGRWWIKTNPLTSLNFLGDSQGSA